jgi:lipoprotein-releasing system permease protein
LKLPVFIAKRYLVSKKSHNAINIISIISVLSVAIVTASLVVILSAFNGLSGLVKTLYNSFDPDIEVSIKQGKTFTIDTVAINKIKAIAGVEDVALTIEENALLKYKDKQCIATVKGVSEEFGSMTRFDTLVKNGEYLLKDGSQSYMVVGRGIAHVLELEYNDVFSPVSVYVPRRGTTVNTLNPEEGFNEKRTYASGVFTINDDFDFKYVLLPLDFVQDLLDKPNAASGMEVGLISGTDNSKVKEEVQKIVGENFLVRNKDEQNQVLFKTLKSEKLWVFIILVFILIIATFNIIGSLTMLMIEKKKDIRILWDMGADRLLIRRIFLWEGIFISLVGSVAGLALGLFVCWLQMQFGFVQFNEGYVVDAYPIKIQAADLLAVLTTVMVIGFFMAWYPTKLFVKKSLA